MAKFFKVIMDILIILFIASFVALFVPPIFGITPVVTEPGVESNLQVGTAAYGKRVSVDDLSVGDTIIYSTEGQTFIYEIAEEIDPDAGTLTVKAYSDGDEATIPARRKATKLLFYVPFLGYIVIALHSTEGIIILGLAALLLIILFIIAEILCKKAKAKNENVLTAEEEEEQDRKYFRDLAVSQGKPSNLDSLGTLTIPPIAELMEEDVTETPNANTIALDEDFENPELILEPVENGNSDTAPVPEFSVQEVSVQETPVQDGAPEEVPVQAEVIEEAPVQAEVIEETPVEGTTSEASPKNIADTSEFSKLGTALEIALENEQMAPTQHSVPQPTTVPEPEIEKPAEEIELVIPARTLDELLQEAYTNGEDPKVSKDAATGITFVDYSNCLN